MKRHIISFVCILTLAAMAVRLVGASINNPDVAECDPETCRLPTCHCAGAENIPGGLNKTQVPQFILLTFDDAVNNVNIQLYNILFNRLKPALVNPNGCPIKATFFVSHEFTNYAHVHDLYADGHEIATHSLTHRKGGHWPETEWAKEIAGHGEVLVKYADISPSKLKGVRAPHLVTSGDSYFDTLEHYDFTYDSSVPTPSYTWPYTLDYRWNEFQCQISECALTPHPGLWEIPLQIEQGIDGRKCAMTDTCEFGKQRRQVYDSLLTLFNRHYQHDRTPLNLFFHSSWFANRSSRKEAFVKFLRTVEKEKDVYFVTMQQLLDWVRHPVPLDQLNESSVFACPTTGLPKKCYDGTDKGSTKCQYPHNGETRIMEVCRTLPDLQDCPRIYPWVRDQLPSLLGDF